MYSISILFIVLVIAFSDIAHTFNGPLSGIIRVGQYQKGKTKLDVTEARDSSGSGIHWVI